MTLPVGIVTFLFTDIEGSTRLWESYPESMEAASAKHDHLMREIIAQNGGQVVKSTGDGFHAVFSSGTDAICAAVAGQILIQNSDWGLPEPLRVRMSLHSGEAQLRDGDYYGSAVNRAARLMGAGSGGQVLLSDVTAKLMGAAEALREAADTPMLIYEQKEFDQHFVRLKDAAELEQFEAAWEAGRHMSMGEAVAYALVFE